MSSLSFFLIYWNSVRKLTLRYCILPGVKREDNSIRRVIRINCTRGRRNKRNGRKRGMNRGRSIGCSTRGKGSVGRGPWGVRGDGMR